MEDSKLNAILQNANTLNDLAIHFFGKKNYTNREKSKLILAEHNINWKDWLDSKKRKPNKCLYCGNEITGKDRFRNKFCNSSCAASYNNTHRKRTSDEVKIKISKALRSKSQTNSKRSDIYLSDLENNTKRICANCGKELAKTQMKFCSQSCAGAFKYVKYIESWKNGEVNGLSGEYNLNKHIRRFLLEKNHYQCEKCGWSEVNEFSNTIPLEIHHIDGDYTNNKEENLQVLCPNCHSLTETYKSHNKNGRKQRKNNK
jgi:predicted RNA-binding Zn-ribbon protein involved in translation (DUF1610 family)